VLRHTLKEKIVLPFNECFFSQLVIKKSLTLIVFIDAIKRIAVEVVPQSKPPNTETIPISKKE
jgi:hypothetical protein